MTDAGGSAGDTMTLTVPSHPKYLYVVRSALYPVVLDAGFTKRETRRIILAVDEACSNIIKYAYGGDHSKTITLTMTAAEDRLTLRLRDSGVKTDPGRIAPRKLEDVRPGGLGTHFMGMVFDRVDYDTSGEQGTVLTLEKRKQQVAR